MRQPRAVIITFVIDEDLRLVLKTPKGRTVDNAITVALKACAYWMGRFGRLPTATRSRSHRVGRKRLRFDRFNIFSRPQHALTVIDPIRPGASAGTIARRMCTG
jgi:hypothetical protein